MEYGTGAIFGCPSGDQRDIEFARKYGLPVTPVIVPADEMAELRRSSMLRTPKPFLDDGVMINSRFLDGMTTTEALRGGRAPPARDDIGREARRRTQGAVSPSGLADFATALLGLSDSGHPLRRLRRRSGSRRSAAGDAPERCVLRQAGKSARSSPGLEELRLRACGKLARRDTDTMDTFVDFVLVFRALHRHAKQSGADQPCPPSMGRAGGCRSSSTSAALNTRFFIRSIRDSSRAR